MILYLIRHAESVYNAEERVQGQRDVPLSDRGHLQRQALAAAWPDRDVEAIYSSPLERARLTAEPLAAALELPIACDDRLKEIDAGILEGMRYTEIVERYPDELARWRSADVDFTLPGGESRRDLMRRGHAVIEAIRAQGLARVVVVSHGGLLAAALKSLLEIPDHQQPFRLLNTSISRIEWDDRLRLSSLNQVDHLAEIGHCGP